MFAAALRAADGRARVGAWLRAANIEAPLQIFAVGKAAGAMTLGALDALGARVNAALVITKDGHVDPALGRDGRIRIIESAHPVPDERSLAAGEALVGAVRTLPAGALPLFLVSGGSSSLVESLRDDCSLADLRALNERGLAAGWDIARLNAERASLSQLKAGGVARLLAGRHALALFISDVPGDDPSLIGSGLLGPCGAMPDAIDRHVVANVELAMRAAVEAGAAHGLSLEPGVARFAGEAVEVADEFVAALRTTAADGLVWGGESTVRLPARAGRGGRNTHLALAAARRLRGAETLTILAAGSDGSDGPTEDAGGLVDACTVERAELAGCDVERALAGCDSGTALEAAEDLVHTGPTGTNVGDLLIGLKRGAAGASDRATPRVV